MKKIGVVKDNPDNRLLAQALFGDRDEMVGHQIGLAAREGFRRDLPEI